MANKLAKAMADRDGGLIFDAGKMTVGEYLDRWLSDSARGTVRKSTYDSYKRQLQRYVHPALGQLALKKLTELHVQGLYCSMQDRGLSARTVRYTHAVLRRALKQAVRWKYIPRNPCDDADFVKPAANVPNIVAICADDMPYWMLSIAMPKTLARLRDEGVRFTNAYCSVPLCGPDRATMFSGRYVHSHDCKTNNGCAGAFRNKGWEADGLAVRMARAGYVTGLLGKYINDYGAAFAPEIPQGYNRFVGYSGEEIQSKDEYELSVDGRTKVYRIADVGETELLADKSELFLRNRNNEMPYFLWLAPTAPHGRTGSLVCPRWPPRDRLPARRWCRCRLLPRPYLCPRSNS